MVQILNILRFKQPTCTNYVEGGKATATWTCRGVRHHRSGIPSALLGISWPALVGQWKRPLPKKKGSQLYSETGRTRLLRARLRAPNSAIFCPHRILGENSASSSQPSIYVQKWTHRVLRWTHRSRNSIPPISDVLRGAQFRKCSGGQISCFRDFLPYRSQEFQNLLWERFQGVSGLLPDLRPEMPIRTEGASQTAGAPVEY